MVCACLEELKEMSQQITIELEGTPEFYLFQSIILDFSLWHQPRDWELHKASQLICDGTWPGFPASASFTQPIAPSSCWIQHRCHSVKNRLLSIKFFFMWLKSLALMVMREEEGKEGFIVLHLLSFRESRASSKRVINRKFLTFE